jgi:hypothetical protein
MRRSRQLIAALKPPMKAAFCLWKKSGNACATVAYKIFFTDDALVDLEIILDYIRAVFLRAWREPLG